MAEVVVTGVGMRTPVGNCSAQTAAVVRARVNRFAVWKGGGVGPGSEPVVASMLEPVVGTGEWTQFALLAAAQPLHEALWQAGVYDGKGWGGAKRRVALYLAGAAQARLDFEEADALEDFRLRGVRDCFEALSQVEPEVVEFLPLGNAAGVVALARAHAALLAGELELAVVGGVDTHLDTGWLARLQSENRLKVGDASNGVTPGEAAAFVVLERSDLAERRGVRALGRIPSVALGVAPVLVGAEHPVQADELSEALRSVLEPRQQGGLVRHVWTDINGERWRSLEWAMAETRSLGQLPPRGWTLWTPVETLGDIGAATAIVQLGIALSWPARGFAVDQHHLVASSSWEGARGAFYIEPLSPSANKAGA